jgi:cytochrome c2
MLRLTIICAAVSFAFVALASSPRAQEPAVANVDSAAKLFVSRCTGCHTIGRGTLTGPDLTAAIAWREADLTTAIVRMQEKAGPLSRDDIAGLIGFLKDPRVKERVATEEARIAQQFAAKLEPPNAEIGGRLFRGEKLLVNGGMACISCHRIGELGGGTLGVDLSGVFGRMGEAGLLSALEKAPFKVMSPVYRAKPLTRQEVLHITSWLKTMDAQSSVRLTDPIGPAAASVAAAFLVALVVGTRKAKRTSARGALAQRKRS